MTSLRHQQDRQDEKAAWLQETRLDERALYNTPARSSRMLRVYVLIGLATMWLLASTFFLSIPSTISSFLFGKASLSISRPSISTTKHYHHPLTRVAHLPSHLVPSRDNDRRIVVVGDVHGSFNELEKLLSHVSFSNETDTLIMAGDMIDKGPDSHKVIKLVRSMNAYCVRGNHEDKTLDAYESFLQSGDDDVYLNDVEDSPEDRRDEIFATLDRSRQKAFQRLRRRAALSRKDVEYIAACPLILSLGYLSALSHASSTVVVHAGLVPRIPLEKQDPFAAMHMRTMRKRHGDYVPEEGRDGGEPWWRVWNREQDLIGRFAAGSSDDAGSDYRIVEEEWPATARRKHESGTMVVYGHDSHQGLNKRKWSLGLDSGCVNGDQLSAAVIDAKRVKIVSVECKGSR